MVESAGLLNPCPGNWTAGSNPVLSAWVTGSVMLVIAQIRISPCQHRGLCRFVRVAARGGVHLLRRIVRRFFARMRINCAAWLVGPAITLA